MDDGSVKTINFSDLDPAIAAYYRRKLISMVSVDVAEARDQDMIDYLANRAGTMLRMVLAMEASLVPGVGEAMDLLVLNDADAAWWARVLAGGSIVLSFVSFGSSPNAGSLLRGNDGLPDSAGDVSPAISLFDRFSIRVHLGEGAVPFLGHSAWQVGDVVLDAQGPGMAVVLYKTYEKHGVRGLARWILNPLDLLRASSMSIKKSEWYWDTVTGSVKAWSFRVPALAPTLALRLENGTTILCHIGTWRAFNAANFQLPNLTLIYLAGRWIWGSWTSRSASTSPSDLEP